MSEIRDRAKDEVIRIILAREYTGFSAYDLAKLADKILSIPELAVVDREAKLEWETETKCIEDCNVTCHSIERNLTQRRMLKAGYVKEDKDEST